MTNIDQFESAFRAADKKQFELLPFTLENVLVVTDLDRADAEPFADEARTLISAVAKEHEPKWTVFGAEQYESIDDLASQIDQYAPDLICTYRNLKSPTRSFNYTLGSYLDIMTQTVVAPVLVLPHPELNDRRVPDNTDSVMVMTDHLTGDNRLVSVAMRLVESGGHIWLTHVEDEQQIQRFLSIVSKIPSLNTESAEKDIRAQMLKEPSDYIESCRSFLEQSDLDVSIKSLVTTGNHLHDYQRLAEEHDVDLLVINTKDEDQLAMHGLAYPLTVELRNTPLLLL